MSDAASCPVCACALSAPVEVCVACHTPHHADCARFVGRCSVFGCGAYDFIALDGAAAAILMPQAPLEMVSTDDALGAVEERATLPEVLRPPGLGRSIPDRIVAATQLLIQNPKASVPVGALLLLFSLLPTLIPGGAGVVMGLLHTIGWLLGQALIVIMLMSRAQGKDPTLDQAMVVANERCRRIVVTGLASCTIVGTAMVAGLLMTLSGFISSSWLMVAGGSLLTLFGLKKFVSWSLVTIIAAMGHDEEPQNALTRSTELIALGRTQASFSVLVFFFGAALLSAMLPLHLRFLATTLVGLVSTAYWTLFYMETRRLHQSTFLPFAPAGYLPPARRQIAPAKAGVGNA